MPAPGAVQISILGLGGLPDWLLRRGFGECLLAEAGVRAAVVAEFQPTQWACGAAASALV